MSGASPSFIPTEQPACHLPKFNLTLAPPHPSLLALTSFIPTEQPALSGRSPYEACEVSRAAARSNAVMVEPLSPITRYRHYRNIVVRHEQQRSLGIALFGHCPGLSGCEAAVPRRTHHHGWVSSSLLPLPLAVRCRTIPHRPSAVVPTSIKGTRNARRSDQERHGA
ncbi:hypothetical protein AAHA92_17646 [Salvia divinorum]|uniref:Uncharacterized protein n=1 Tax=Salvia divinorum TaxID=28513 RepID=A0ABD1H3F9_SALDI